MEKSERRSINRGGKLRKVCWLKKEERNNIKEGGVILKNGRTSTERINLWPKSDTSPMTTVHIFGSLPLNKHTDFGELGELKKDSRIKVCDASLLPEAPWGNPQAVVMVLNEILIDKWLNEN